MNSTKTEGNPSPEDRRRKKTLAIGLALVGILVGGGIWGSSLSAPSTPASAVDATQAGAAPPQPATPTSPAKKAAPGGTSAPASQPSAPAPVAASPAAAAAASSDVKLASVDQPVAPPVPLNHTASIRDGITAEITGLESVHGQAQKAGEVAGPSLRFTVTIHNSTDHPLSTADVVVNVNAGVEDLPAITLSGPDVSAFPPAIVPGASGSATYVFRVPVDQRGKVRVLVNFQVDSPIAAFEGAAPTEGKP